MGFSTSPQFTTQFLPGDEQYSAVYSSFRWRDTAYAAELRSRNFTFVQEAWINGHNKFW
jgi:hypothetical protein